MLNNLISLSLYMNIYRFFIVFMRELFRFSININRENQCQNKKASHTNMFLTTVIFARSLRPFSIQLWTLLLKYIWGYTQPTSVQTFCYQKQIWVIIGHKHTTQNNNFVISIIREWIINALFFLWVISSNTTTQKDMYSLETHDMYMSSKYPN